MAQTILTKRQQQLLLPLSQHKTIQKYFYYPFTQVEDGKYYKQLGKNFFSEKQNS